MGMKQPVVGIFTEKGGSSKSDVAANLLGIILIKAWDLSLARRPVRGRRPYKSQSDGWTAALTRDKPKNFVHKALILTA